ncbi:MAG: protein TolQ [Pseudomonadota bacterium]
MEIWSLVANATWVVQLVMLMLIGASVMSWVLIGNRFQVLRRAGNAAHGFEDRFWSGGDLTQLFSQVKKAPDPDSGMETIFMAGFKEYARLRNTPGSDSEAVMEATHRAMRIAMSREQERLEKHLSFLATVGSTSPYVGLFGTVWGIMNSFRSLATVNQATLQVVAPGIAEALIATAIGLFAAIPAVIAYNRYSAQVDALLNRYATFAEEFYAILHRQSQQGRH